MEEGGDRIAELEAAYRKAQKRAIIAASLANEALVELAMAKRTSLPSGAAVNPAKEKKQKEDDGPFFCEGNLFAGTPCPGICKKRAADTRFEKKLHVTCKDCKKAMKKEKKQAADE